MVLVSISGAIGSGKSTFAELLTAIDPKHSLHLETSTIISELGNSFNTALRNQGSTASTDITLVNGIIEILLPRLEAIAGSKLLLTKVLIEESDITKHPEIYEKLFLYLKLTRENPSLLKEPITPLSKNNYRALLQWIGGYFLYRLQNPLLWYEEVIRRAKLAGPEVELIALTAPRQPIEAAFVQEQGGKVIKIIRPGLDSDTTDVTEKQVAAIVADCTIINNADLIALQKATVIIRQEILADRLQKTYTTSELTQS